MKGLGKPKNRWGWFRVACLVVFAGIVAWSLLAAGLRGIGAVSWMSWSRYQTFSLWRGLELAVVPLAAAYLAHWMEEHEHIAEVDMIKRQEAEQTRALQREEAIKQFRQAMQTLLVDADRNLPETRVKISRIVWASLREMDGKGKGEILNVLNEFQLLTGDIPCVEITSEDFSGVVLKNAQFEGVCLEGIDFSRAQMSGARLVNSNLSGSNLRNAILRQANLSGTTLCGSNLRGANLDGANLEGADLRGAYLDGALLQNASLRNCIVFGFLAEDVRPPASGSAGSHEPRSSILDTAILIDTILPDGRKTTNEKGHKYLRDKEFSMLVDKL